MDVETDVGHVVSDLFEGLVKRLLVALFDAFFGECAGYGEQEGVALD
jgi:hypothetical protein